MIEDRGNPSGAGDLAARFGALAAGNVARRSAMDYDARLDALKRLGGALRDFDADIIAALKADLGKPETEVRLTEILPVQAEIKHTVKHLRRWMRPRAVRGTLLGFGMRGQIRPEPKGTVLIIAPWNYPLGLALGPLVSALAAGNGALIKPSELAPATSALLGRIVQSCFPPDLVTVAEGGAEVAQTLLDLPFDHVFFTGSPEIGKKVMAQAARNLVPVTLELGGKSPVIVGAGADMAQAAQAVAWGKFANAGQTCIAPDHGFVAASHEARFLAELKKAVAKMYGRADLPPSEAYAQIVSGRHFDRLVAMREGALQAGAELVLGGADHVAERRIAPTVLTRVDPDNALMQEEIFGPILPVIPFDDLDAVIARINAGAKPLALYVFEKDMAQVDRIARETSSGAVGINLALAHYLHLNLPFGGIGNSGMGAAHGEWGFRAFSHEKPLLANRFAPLSNFMPPYRGMRARRLAMLLRVLGR